MWRTGIDTTSSSSSAATFDGTWKSRFFFQRTTASWLALLSLSPKTLHRLIARERVAITNHNHNELRFWVVRVILCAVALLVGVWLDQKTNAYRRPPIALGLGFAISLLMICV